MISKTSRKLLSPSTKFSMQSDLCLFNPDLLNKKKKKKEEVKQKNYRSYWDVRFDCCSHSDTNCPSIIVGSSDGRSVIVEFFGLCNGTHICVYTLCNCCSGYSGLVLVSDWFPLLVLYCLHIHKTAKWYHHNMVTMYLTYKVCVDDDEACNFLITLNKRLGLGM